MNPRTARRTAAVLAAAVVAAVGTVGWLLLSAGGRAVAEMLVYQVVLLLQAMLGVVLIVLIGVGVVGLPLWILLTLGWVTRRRNARAGRLTRNYLAKVVRRRLAREPDDRYDAEFAQSLLWWAQQRVKYDTSDGVEMGEAYGKVLMGWCARQDTDLRLLRNAFVLGVSPAELEAHLDGTALLDAEALEMLVGLRGE